MGALSDFDKPVAISLYAQAAPPKDGLLKDANPPHTSMNVSIEDTHRFDGQMLKRKIVSSVSDSDAYKLISHNPRKFWTAGDPNLRPNMLKARSEAMHERLASFNASDPWVREVVDKWVEMSGLTRNDADFWRELGFMEAVRAGRDVMVRRFLDDDGWAWIVVRDSPMQWSHKRRLPESTRLEMVAQKARKNKAGRY